MQSTRHTRVVKWPRESLRLQVSPTNLINQQLKKKRNNNNNLIDHALMNN